MKLQPQTIAPFKSRSSQSQPTASTPSASPAPFDIYTLLPNAAPSHTSSTSPALHVIAAARPTATQSDTPIRVGGVEIGTAHTAGSIKIFGGISPQTEKFIIGASVGIGGVCLVGAAIGGYLAWQRRAHRQAKAFASGTSSDASSVSA